ncbi:hypothetical protein BDY24DRAFT_417194 [Mrakia frigida]|uniref:uncharacterized protein n=1 Tax=Mrakia frigida TaxID=29902 RepID=UPI003FCC1C67
MLAYSTILLAAATVVFAKSNSGPQILLTDSPASKLDPKIFGQLGAWTPWFSQEGRYQISSELPEEGPSSGVNRGLNHIVGLFSNASTPYTITSDLEFLQTFAEDFQSNTSTQDKTLSVTFVRIVLNEAVLLLSDLPDRSKKLQGSTAAKARKSAGPPTLLLDITTNTHLQENEESTKEVAELGHMGHFGRIAAFRLPTKPITNRILHFVILRGSVMNFFIPKESR